MGHIELLTNLKSWDAWDFASFKIERDDAPIVISALEKAKAAKPIVESVGEKTISGTCPECNTSAVFIVGDERRISYCKYCGKKLDWSEPFRCR